MMDPVCIRHPVVPNGELTVRRLCGKTDGGTISLRHFFEQKEHVGNLKICNACSAFAIAMTIPMLKRDAGVTS